MLPTVPGGVVPPVITPLTPEGEVDTGSLSELVGLMVDAGVSGLFPLGSSGEVSFLSREQRKAVLSTVVQSAGGRVPVLAGTIDLSMERVLENIRDAAEAGADIAVVTAPFYARVNERDIERHFRSIAAASPLPLVAYDIPVNVGHKLKPDMLVRLGQDEVIGGVKDSSGVGYEFRLLAMRNRQVGSPLTLLTGTEVLVDADVLIGANGVVPGLANVVPDAYVRLYELCASGRWNEASALQERLVDLFQIITCDRETTGPAQAIGAFKEAMKVRGMIAHAATARPSFPISDEARREIKELVQQYEARD